MSAIIGGQAVLQDVTLEMAATDWLAVVGGSGAGKSTLLRAIMGLTRPARPTAGRMTFNGQRRDFAAAGKVRLAGIAFVPQSPTHGFDPLRRLRWQWDQLARHNQTAAGKDRLEILSALGLPDLGASYPHQWSRGMQQRLLLAMALADAPRLLILDEPTSALDPLIAAQVLQETQQLAQERNIAVMMVTHDLSLAARFANKIAIMQAGRVVESGPADQLLSTPQHPYAQELVSHRGWQRADRDHRHAAE
ncbi:ATP-binding cassette domain-containing protein [Pseudophaeobacter sp.]|uniref:ATP-binding cassette domain-containing protein n=1 Tax=Pseudophaeobacter sp. TaxID=1971739 RepID=UPI003297853D